MTSICEKLASGLIQRETDRRDRRRVLISSRPRANASSIYQNGIVRQKFIRSLKEPPSRGAGRALKRHRPPNRSIEKMATAL